MTILERGVIVCAYGVPYYIEMAKTLARSLRLHSPHIPRAIVTDNQDDRELRELFDYIIPLKKEYGSNVVQKLHLHKYSPFKRTLYVDSDCIAVRDINFIFDAFEGRSFSVPGDKYLQAGDKDTFLNVDYILKKFSLEKLPKFNGGLLYFDQSETAKAVFETALSILRDWKKLGMAEFRGDGPNEEGIFAIAMMLHNQTMFEDNGQMMRTPIGIHGALEVDTFTGKSTFKKYNKVVSPAVVHFACVWAEHPVYHREVSKLKDPSKSTANQVDSDIFSAIKYKFGYQIALVRYIAKRVPKNFQYLQTRTTRFLRQLPQALQTNN